MASSRSGSEYIAVRVVDTRADLEPRGAPWRCVVHADLERGKAETGLTRPRMTGSEPKSGGVRNCCSVRRGHGHLNSEACELTDTFTIGCKRADGPRPLAFRHPPPPH